MFQRKLKSIVGALVACGTVLSLHAQMAQDPLLSRTAAVEPNIVFMFDDSGSMPATAIYQYGGSAGGMGMTGPGNDSFSTMLSPPTSFYGRSPDVNLIYYDPRVTYARRINANGTYQAAGSTGSISSFNVYFYKPSSTNVYSVASVPVTAGGSGYPATGIVAAFSQPPTGGVQAAATVITATSPNVAFVTVTNGGIDYPATGVIANFSAPASGGVQATGTVVVANTTTNKVSGVTINTGGAGYSGGTTVTFSPPPAGGTTATGTMTRGSNGAGRPIVSITITNPGSGYVIAPTITLSNTSGGLGATFTVSLASVATRLISAITVTNGGSGYTSAPTVTLGNPGSGSGATFTLTRGTTNVIAAINVTNPGSGYVTPPTLGLTSTSPGTGAAYTVNPSATAIVAENRTWDGTGTPTAVSNYFNPSYTPDSGGPLASGASAIPYPNTASSTTANYPKFRNRTDCATAVCTWAQEQQNYANWKTYHSTRLDLAKTGIGLAFQPLNPTFRLGWGTINTLDAASRLDKGVRLYNATVQNDFLTWLYAVPANGYTPNRNALDKVGQYYKRADNGGPWADAPTGDTSISSGAEDTSHATCRRSYAMLMTDGYYNESFTMADVDTSAGPRITQPSSYQYTPIGPYSDTRSGTQFSNSFADVAMKYWVNDLRPNLPNNVRGVAGDEAYWQHLNFYAIGLGITGTLDATDPSVLAALTGNGSTTPPRTLDWPTPAADSPRSIDDMWHATVNGRGKLLNAKTSDELNNAIQKMMSDIGGKEGTQSGVAVSTASLTKDTKKYTPRYTPITWNGNVTAYNLDPATGNETGTAAWQVETLVATDPVTGAKTYSSLIPPAASRNIYVGNGASSGTRAVPFTYPALNSAGLLSSMTGTVDASLINFLRGDPTNEDSSNSSSSSTAIYRGRVTRLGDIVNSTPVFVKDSVDLQYGPLPNGTGGLPAGTPGASTYNAFVATKKARTEGVLFVGANDGMLHAFRDGTYDPVTGAVVTQGGLETFAYVPKALLPTLNQLADKTYTHRFYVDGPNVETDAYFGASGWANVLLGTTGAGAGTPGSPGVSPRTAVFALDVTSLNTSPTSLNASNVLWEVSSTSSGFAELGYVLTDVQAGPTKSGDWVAVFGNGYESKSCQARLFVVNVQTGALIREINTGVGSCTTAGKNGLGGVRLVRDSRQQIIGVYAGDLQGNLWKFSLNDSNSSNWKVDLGGAPLLAAGPSQPITAAPAVVTLTSATQPGSGFMVVAGTGKFFEVSDILNTSQQSLYGVWDPLAFGAGTIPAGTSLSNKSLLVQQTVGSAQAGPNGNTYFAVSNNPVSYTGAGAKRGWWIDFPNTGQRLVYPLDLLVSRFVLADTISPANVSLDPCSNTTSGTGYVYLIDALNGGGPTEAVLDTNGDGNINTADMVVSGLESKADGRNVTLEVSRTAASTKLVNVSASSGSILLEISCRLTNSCPPPASGATRFKSREWRQLFMR